MENRNETTPEWSANAVEFHYSPFDFGHERKKYGKR